LQREAVRALEIAPGDPKEFVAGTLSGVFRSNDAGESWQRISPEGDEELRRLDSLAIDPRDGNVIYAGTYHLPWKIVDGGKSWNPVIAGLIDDSDIMSLRVDATEPQRVYLSACSGIYRSENQGGSWTKLQGIPYAARRTQTIVQDAAQPKTLYAATTEGLWVTRDAGESWKRTTPKEWVINGVVVLRATAAQPGRVLIGTEGQGILVSDDDGETFSAANAGFTHPVVTQLAGDPKQPNHLLILLQTGGARLLESQDAGANWAPVALRKGGTTKELQLEPESVERIYGTPWGWLVRSVPHPVSTQPQASAILDLYGDGSGISLPDKYLTWTALYRTPISRPLQTEELLLRVRMTHVQNMQQQIGVDRFFKRFHQGIAFL
jgi:photosystem II stability/assembly factor-like uncharacterized protein